MNDYYITYNVTGNAQLKNIAKRIQIRLKFIGDIKLDNNISSTLNFLENKIDFLDFENAVVDNSTIALFLRIGGRSLKCIKFPKQTSIFPDPSIQQLQFCFRDFSALEIIELPEGLIELIDFAFYGCKNLKTVTLPSSLISINNSAFCDCLSLKAMAFPFLLKHIGSSAFSGCISIDNLSLPERITSIQPFTFKDCYSLKNIIIPRGILQIQNYAFSGCRSLEMLTIPKNVMYVHENAFFNCISLRNVNIESEFPSIEDNVFHGCFNLDFVTIPNIKFVNLFQRSNLYLNLVMIPPSATDILHKKSMLKQQQQQHSNLQSDEAIVQGFNNICKEVVPGIEFFMYHKITFHNITSKFKTQGEIACFINSKIANYESNEYTSYLLISPSFLF